LIKLLLRRKDTGKLGNVVRIVAGTKLNLPS
jgi:hypothetical protein